MTKKEEDIFETLVFARSNALESAWFVYNDNGDHVGPVGTALLVKGIVAGKVPRDALVRGPIEVKWRPWLEVAEISDAVEEREAAAPLLAPTPQAPNPRLQERAGISAGVVPAAPTVRQLPGGDAEPDFDDAPEVARPHDNSADATHLMVRESDVRDAVLELERASGAAIPSPLSSEPTLERPSAPEEPPLARGRALSPPPPVTRRISERALPLRAPLPAYPPPSSPATPPPSTRMTALRASSPPGPLPPPSPLPQRAPSLSPSPSPPAWTPPVSAEPEAAPISYREEAEIEDDEEAADVSPEEFITDEAPVRVEEPAIPAPRPSASAADLAALVRPPNPSGPRLAGLSPASSFGSPFVGSAPATAPGHAAPAPKPLQPTQASPVYIPSAPQPEAPALPSVVIETTPAPPVVSTLLSAPPPVQLPPPTYAASPFPPVVVPSAVPPVVQPMPSYTPPPQASLAYTPPPLAVQAYATAHPQPLHGAFPSAPPGSPSGSASGSPWPSTAPPPLASSPPPPYASRAPARVSPWLPLGLFAFFAVLAVLIVAVVLLRGGL